MYRKAVSLINKQLHNFKQNQKTNIHANEVSRAAISLNTNIANNYGMHNQVSLVLYYRYIRLQEHGLNDRANRLIYAKKPVCSVMGSSFGSVNMVDFYPVLLMLLYGMILAFALLVVEIFVHRRQEM